MSLKTVIDSDQFGELDEGLQSLYTAGEGDFDGQYVLNLDGIDSHPAVVGLRNGHKRSKEERRIAREEADKLKKRLGPLLEENPDLDLSDLDHDRVERALRLLNGEDLEDDDDDDDKGKGKGKDDKNKMDLEKVKANARKPLERQLEQVTQERDDLSGKLTNLVVDNALTNAVSEINVHPPFVRAVKAMFRDSVKIANDDDGNPIAIIEGEYGEQPVDKYLKEWAQTDEGREYIASTRNSGGGAGGGSGGNRGVKNPWAKESWSMTEQARIFREDPERAKRMAAEHGHKVG